MTHCTFETGERLVDGVIAMLQVYDDVGNSVTIVVKDNLVEVWKTSFGKQLGKIYQVHVNEACVEGHV